MPISEKQKKIMAFPYTNFDALIANGAIRSGKTVFILLMIRESKRFDEMYGQKQVEDDIVSLAEKAKYNKTAAKIFNQLDKKVQEEYNEYKQWHGQGAMEDLACRRVDCYWWTMFQLLFYGKPQKTYCDYVYEITFGR